MGRMRVYDWAGYTLLRLGWFGDWEGRQCQSWSTREGLDGPACSKEMAGGGGTRRRNGNDTRTPEQQRPRMTDDSNTHHCLFGVVFLALRLAESHGAMGWAGSCLVF